MDKDSTEKPLSKYKLAELRQSERWRVRDEDDKKEQPSWLPDGAVKWPLHDGRWWFPVRWRDGYMHRVKCPECDSFPAHTAFYGFSYKNDPGWSREFLWSMIDGQTWHLQSFRCLECGHRWIESFHAMNGIDEVREMRGFVADPPAWMYPAPPKVPKVKKEPRTAGTSLRFQVLQRDGFKCVYCGAAAADGAVLQIDHVHPASKGGPTTLENLVAACQPCNNGKRDRVIEPAGGA